jgi:hypothetical protein
VRGREPQPVERHQQIASGGRQPTRNLLAQFGGEDYNDDLARLKSLLGNLGCAIPPLYKQYSEANIALIAIRFQIGQIHQHQTIHAVIEIRIAAEIGPGPAEVPARQPRLRDPAAV